MRRVSAIAVAVLVVGCKGSGKEGAPGGGQGSAPSGGGASSSARVETARRMAEKLAFEAYPQWVVHPANTDRCPTLADLKEYLEREPTDPWGQPFHLRCDDLPPDAHGIAVWSVGPDGKDGTADDVHSWEP